MVYAKRFASVLIILLLMGCIGTTPKEQKLDYYTASEAMIQLMREYKLQKPSMTEEQIALADEYILKANEALDMWHQALYQDGDTTTSEDVFLEWKTKLIQLLRERSRDGQAI